MSDLPQTIVCKAAVVMAPGQPFEIIDVNVAPPKRGEVRIKILYACPCHTDEITQRGVDPTGVYPCILGHESCGEVESIGEGVITCKPGDKVIPLWEGVMPLDNTSRFTTMDGKPIHHFMGTSSFSQYTVVPQECVAVIPDNSPMNLMCLLGCGVPTGMGAAMNTGKVEKGSTVAVYGLGCVGLACVEGASLCGAKEIICVDINEHKLEVAKKFGGTKFINPKKFDKPIQEVIIDMTDGGVDFAFECTGSTNVMRSALESTCKGWGLAVIVGIGEAGKEISTRPYHFIVGRQLKGSVFGGWRSREDIPKLAQKVINGEIRLEKYCTHSMHFSQINEAFDLLKKTECIRCVMNMQEE
ncbi:alcohol dehydrogenase class III, putative [Eimeria mitis]|uniref:Alcohol dehydrogenase class III, putative n=1 Tax=Eimeria mitis TaxID=44415 RepID=U6JYN0_9EIME|nr:alcohol dehydrogenase class III, putative [Eimeria mitis]CDJ30529.1 alcohol dehydrogenase class III, putative [Eimeria mitis]